jgi:hypothetical protein
MSNFAPTSNELSVVPLGPGDLIDRAVRFYRKNFTTFILIAAPPVVVATIFTVGWTFLARWAFPTGANINSPDFVIYMVFAWLGKTAIWLIETVATLAVMGGASRNFVRHILFGEKITFAETYKNTWSRVGGLIAASLIITILLAAVGGAVFYFGIFVGLILAAIAVAIFSLVPAVAAVAAIIISLAVAIAFTLIFFLVASRFAYVPQVMLVEGQGVFASIGRSLSLASGNVKRFAALFLFTIVATYSALAILYIPLGWYAWFEGVDLFGFNGALTPAWFEIAQQLVSQASIILLSPIWMVGLCLLYVDERVRHEGYDIELMAARRLGEIPDVPDAYLNPLTPALASADRTAPAVSKQQNKSASILGLK